MHLFYGVSINLSDVSPALDCENNVYDRPIGCSYDGVIECTSSSKLFKKLDLESLESRRNF